MPYVKALVNWLTVNLTYFMTRSSIADFLFTSLSLFLHPIHPINLMFYVPYLHLFKLIHPGPFGGLK